MRTAQRPAITTMHASDPSVSSSNRPPFGMRSALKLTWRQPADSGVTETRPSWPRTSSELTRKPRAESSQVAPLLLLRLLVALARVSYARGLRRCRDGDLPPALVARHGHVPIDLDVDHDGPLDLLRGGERVAQLRDTPSADDVRAEALGVRGEVHRQIRRRVALAVETASSGLRFAELRTESVGPERSGESADRCETVIVHEHDDELRPLLERRDDRLVQHQVGAVAHERVHLALGSRELHAERARDLVAHARVPVLDVV